MRRTLGLRAEFEKAVKKSMPPLHAGIGADYNKAVNFLWKSRVVRRTTDANRLQGTARYGFLLDRINLPEDKADMLADLRKDDHRRVQWKCPGCGQHFTRSVKAAVHYGKHMCARCTPFTLHTAPDQPTPQLAKDVLPANALKDAEGVQPDVLPATSKSRVAFSCKGCGAKYHESVRARSGAVAASIGTGAMYPPEATFGHCPTCRFTNLAKQRTSFMDAVRYD
jgi:hypothetical protein